MLCERWTKLSRRILLTRTGYRTSRPFARGSDSSRWQSCELSCDSPFILTILKIKNIYTIACDCHLASRYYPKGSSYTLKSVKTTALVDCETSIRLDIQCSTKQPPDTHVGQQIPTANLCRLQAATADRGYNWDNLRKEVREVGFRPVIKRREFFVG